ncbi:reverse transcriptase domain-containing protein [Tanacetum coccineum]
MRTRSQSREQATLLQPRRIASCYPKPLRIVLPISGSSPTVEPMADTRIYGSIAPSTHRGNKQFFGHDKKTRCSYRYFNKITSTMRVPNVPIATIIAYAFPLIEGAARIWLEKEPPRSIQTWDDLVSKFINQFFPPSKTTNLRNEITRFQQRFDESFSKLGSFLMFYLGHVHTMDSQHCIKLDSFYNALNIN